MINRGIKVKGLPKFEERIITDNDTIKMLYDSNKTSVCFFRSTKVYPEYKCLIQITERCNFKCKHCFLSANNTGNQMDINKIERIVIPYFVTNKITKVTLTGGEPLVHCEIVRIINSFTSNGIDVTVCSNGSLISKHLIESINDLGKVKFNISLHGFTEESFAKFEENASSSSLDCILENLRLLSQYSLLKGILVTPNEYATIDEYIELCEFSKCIGAKYVLFNPLSEYGRGIDAKVISYGSNKLNALREATSKFIDQTFEVIYVRFPNIGKSLTRCNCKSILYLFENGDISICPYMVFGTSNSNSRYKREQFILGNIFNTDEAISDLLSKYQLPTGNVDNYDEIYKRGCMAIKIAKGKTIEAFDQEMM